ncbi:MAG: MFS transporter, partial [Candidatus Saccharimonadales bacterium]
AFIVIALYCPSLKHVKKPRIDYIGAALLAVALATLVLSVDNTENIFSSLLSATGISLLTLRLIMTVIVIVAVTAFILVERHSTEPILELSFFRNKNFLVLSGIAMSVGAAMLGSILYLTQFNQQVYDASPTESGLMLLPMIAGLMVVSITTGQLVTKYGKYKRFMIVGFAVATLAIGSLVTLTPSSPFIHEAIIIVFVGMGIGAGMPLLNIAIQNEFSQRNLGMATSSSQLFRGLGSTIGVAIFGSMLTAGIVASLGDMKDDAYIRTLSHLPQSSQLVTSTSDPNTLLQLNMSDIRTQIASGYDAGISKLVLPDSTKAQMKRQFITDQTAYNNKVSNAFTSSLHKIFIVTASTMFAALLLSIMLTERPLRTASLDETPGEVTA